MDHKEFNEHIEEKQRAIMIVCRDKWAKGTTIHIAKAKGNIEVAKKLVAFQNFFGHNEIALEPDNEATIEVLTDEVVNIRKRPTRLGGTMSMRLQIHGKVAKIVQEIIDQIRALKVGLEKNVKFNIFAKKSIMHWLAHRATTTMNKHQIGHDGKIVYQKIHQREPPTTQFEFGEQMLAKLGPKKKHQ